jgi:PAS domain S-box-containing protein
MSRASSEWLLTTVTAVRELMIARLESESLDADSHRDVEMALEELDVMWEELQGQALLLSRENERYAEFFEYAPDAYLITDQGGTVREANKAAGELFKLARTDILGKPLSEFVAPDDRVTFLSETVRAMVGGAPNKLAWRSLVQPMGAQALMCEFSVRAIPLKKSGVGGLCWLIRPA